MADFLITVSVNTGTTPPSLTYVGTGLGGSTNGATSHRVFKNSNLFFTCPDGDLLIQFKNPSNGNRRPFISPNGGVNVIVTAARGARTPVLTTKNNNSQDTIRYTAVVARPTGPPFMISEDPELEDGGDPGGPPRKKKAAPKKAATPKKKAKK